MHLYLKNLTNKNQVSSCLRIKGVMSQTLSKSEKMQEIIFYYFISNDLFIFINVFMRILDPLELQTVVAAMWVLGIEPRSSSAFNH